LSDEEQPSDPSDFDADALAALARPSGAPSAMDDDDGDGGMLDLRALAASAAPPPPEDADDGADEQPDESAAVPAAKGESVAKSKAASTAKAASTPEPATAAVRPAGEKKGGSGMVIGVAIGLAAAAAAFFFMRPSQPDPLASAANAPATTATGLALAPPDSLPSIDVPPADGPPSAAVQPGAAVEGDAVPGTEPSAATDAVPTTETHPLEASTTEGATEEGRHHGTRHANHAEQDHSAEADTHTEETHEAAPVVAAAPATMATMQAESEHGSDDRSMDQLLNSALGGEPAQGGTMTAPVASAMAAAPAADANLPESPSRSVVTRVLGGLMSQMRSCAGDQVGMANARIRISNDGTVASVAIAGAPFGGTPQGTCMENVVRRAHFPRFSRPTIDLTFPFSIRPLN